MTPFSQSPSRSLRGKWGLLIREQNLEWRVRMAEDLLKVHSGGSKLGQLVSTLPAGENHPGDF